MKLSFSLKNKEANLEADVEDVVKEGMYHKSKRPLKKTRYQIRQEEKRKNEELRQKHFIQGMLMMGGNVNFYSNSLCYWNSNELVKDSDC